MLRPCLFVRGPCAAGVLGGALASRPLLFHNRSVMVLDVTTVDDSLLDLLGDTRARLVTELRDQPQGVAELASTLGLSEVAVRRHAHALEDDGLIVAETVRRDGPGRPAAQYRLTERGRRLLPDRSAELANDLFDFLQHDGGRPAVLRFLRWRRSRQQARYAEALDGEAPAERAEQLAGLLTEDGFPSMLTTGADESGRTKLLLRQQHCAIRDVAAEHPEVCAFEAAMFRDLLGVRVSRRTTIAAGAEACVCELDTDCGPAPGPPADDDHDDPPTTDADRGGTTRRQDEPDTRGAHHGHAS